MAQNRRGKYMIPKVELTGIGSTVSEQKNYTDQDGIGDGQTENEQKETHESEEYGEGTEALRLPTNTQR